MSERLDLAPKHEALPIPEAHESLPTEAQAEALRVGEKAPDHLNLEAVHNNVEAAVETAKTENPFEKLKAEEQATAEAATPKVVNRELKDITLNRSLRRIQRDLPAPTRALSKVIHQPVVRAVSEGASKTVTRPSGLLGGGIMAFVGTSLYVYFTKHIGLTYNYFLFVLFFVGGFAIGLVIEFIIWVLAHKNQQG